jgi:hypothetical protein
VTNDESILFQEIESLEKNQATLHCFALMMKTNNVEKVLDLAAGHGRDSIFFASNGIEVEALGRFSLGQLHFIFSEIRRVLKHKGFNFSVRNRNDKSYGEGLEIENGISS